MSLRLLLALALSACATTSPYAELSKADAAVEQGRLVDALQHVMVARSLHVDHPGVQARLPLLLRAQQTGSLDGIAWLDARCLGGELAACRQSVEARQVASLPDRAVRPPTDALSQDLAMLQEACAADHGPACTTLGDLLLKGSAKAPERATQGAQLHTRACRLGQASSCGTLSTLLMEGHGVDPDPQAAFTLGLGACKDEVASACATAARLIEEGQVPSPSEDMAPGLRRKACDLGHEPACRMLHQP